MQMTYWWEGRETREKLWGPGPWVDEPDRVDLVHEASGYPITLIRHEKHGFWAGYVGVPSGHPLGGADYEDIDATLQVHCGLSFSCGMKDVPDERRRSLPEFGGHWFFGFDAAHAWDLVPAWFKKPEPWPMAPMMAESTYRDFRYMRAEAERLAQQLFDWRDKPAPNAANSRGRA